MQVSKILQNKGSEVYTIAPSATIETAVQRLRDAGIGALVVSGNGKSVDGIVSERDFVHGLADSGVKRAYTGLVARPCATRAPINDWIRP